MHNNTVFIHSNKKQYVGALVAKYMLQKYSKNTDKFSVEIIALEDYPALYDRQGQSYTRSGRQVKWDNNDLQSFTLLRFLPPELMNFKGRSIVIDPDIFALADIYDLFSRDMNGKALMCRAYDHGAFASSVMLFDNEKMQHWDWEKDIADLFNGGRDYRTWMSLELEDPDTIGLFESDWNSFDQLDENTKMLHTTQRLTQPWRAGLPISFDTSEKMAAKKTWKHYIPFKNTIKAALGRPVALPEQKKPDTHLEHPDQKQTDLFFSHLIEAINSDIVTDSNIQGAIQSQDLRPDIYDVLKDYKAQAA